MRDEIKYKTTLFDQTLQEWLEKDNPSGKGTGLFLFEDDVKGKDTIPDLTYEECQAIAKEGEIICFRWIPHAVISYEDLINDNYEKCCGTNHS